jgi:ketosteroid isomerase-like protein
LDTNGCCSVNQMRAVRELPVAGGGLLTTTARRPSLANSSKGAARMANLPIPEADAAIRAEIIDWLERFAACVRDVDFRSAYPFWHDEIVIFGTYQELVRSRQAWTDTQWSNVWPRTKDFAIDAANTLVLASADGSTAVAVVPWTSTGFHEDGREFPRPGRATIMLQRQPDGRWVGVHSHMSLGRGVPQDSHGTRPIKAR